MGHETSHLFGRLQFINSSRFNRSMLMRLSTILFRFLASLKLAVTLLIVLASVLAWATILETQHGATHARWYVYEAGWFVGLLTVLGVNIFCAAAIRFPWKRYQTGFVVTHAGLLVLLCGSIVTFVGGVEGRVSLVEGESTQNMALARQSQISAFWVGRPQEPPYEFLFDAGPVEWPASKSLYLGEVDRVGARVIQYLQHPRGVETWIRDDTKLGGPAVKFKVSGKDGVTVAQSWLVDHQYGDAVQLGPLRLQLERAVSDVMLEDFLEPRTAEFGEKGTLVMYFGGIVERVSVDQHVGEKIALGNTGVTVEIAEYLPNASPDNLGNFRSKGEQPKNPMVELRVFLAGEAKPLRQIAFAKDVLLNLDGVYARVCPVKFRFHHPAIPPKSGLELLQTSDGKLFGRLCSDGKYQPKGEVKRGDKILTGANFQLEFVEHLPSASSRISFEQDDALSSRKAIQQSEPAALVEITAGGTTQQIWMRRSDPNFGQRTISTPSGMLAVSFEHARVPLGFSLKLVDFRREMNPGNAGNAAFASRVHIVDSARGEDAERAISMNEPLTHRKFTFYQSGFDDALQGRETSSFSVAYDPGRGLKYAGSLMICLGIAIMFYMRAYFFKTDSRSTEPDASVPQSSSLGENPIARDLESAA